MTITMITDCCTALMSVIGVLLLISTTLSELLHFTSIIFNGYTHRAIFDLPAANAESTNNTINNNNGKLIPQGIGFFVFYIPANKNQRTLQRRGTKPINVFSNPTLQKLNTCL